MYEFYKNKVKDARKKVKYDIVILKYFSHNVIWIVEKYIFFYVSFHYDSSIHQHKKE